MLATQSVQKTLSLQKCPLTCQTAKIKKGGGGGSITALPEFLECYLLLCAAYSEQCFHFQINAPPSSRFIYCNYLSPFTPVTPSTTQLPLCVTISGFLPEQVSYFNTELLVYSIFTIEYSRELFV
jgi:hypothetical protein